MSTPTTMGARDASFRDPGPLCQVMCTEWKPGRRHRQQWIPEKRKRKWDVTGGLERESCLGLESLYVFFLLY